MGTSYTFISLKDFLVTFDDTFDGAPLGEFLQALASLALEKHRAGMKGPGDRGS